MTRCGVCKNESDNTPYTAREMMYGSREEFPYFQCSACSCLQIADVPARNEPGTGEINYRNVLAALDRLGYTGWVGCEYRPAAGTEAGLAWMNTL